MSAIATLVDEILLGRKDPRIPSCVAAALDELEAARNASPALAANAAHAR